MPNPNIAEEGKQFHWKPGVAQNPGGRPKGLQRQLRELLIVDIDAYVARLKELALGPDMRLSLEAIKEVLYRIYGRAPPADEISERLDQLEQMFGIDVSENGEVKTVQ